MSSMVVRRVGAAVVAVGLVIGAVVVRRALDDNGNTDGSATSSTDAPSTSGTVLACVTELASVCNALDTGRVTVRVESWSATVSSITDGDGPDAWLTFAPLDGLAKWPGAAVALASSPMIAVSKADRAAALSGSCSAEFWVCVGNAAGGAWTQVGGQASWGKVLPGFADPTDSAIGVLGLGAASTAYFGTEAFGSTQIESDDGFFGWFSRIATSVPDNATVDPLALLLRQPSAVNVVSTTQASFDRTAGARSSEFTTTYPGPMARADVVVVSAESGAVSSSLTEQLATLLADSGWGPVSADPNHLPAANTLVRLRSLWEETR